MIKLRTYQQQAVEAMAQHARGVCVAPAGSGKTIVAAEIIRRAWRRDGRALWVAHTTEQVEQGEMALAALGVVGVEVCCYASRPSLLGVSVLVVDECHRAGADSVRGIVDGMAEECNIYGFTATPRREDGIDITQIIGPVRYEITRADVLAVGGVLPAEVRVVEVGVRGEHESAAQQMAENFYTGGMRWMDCKEGNTTRWNRCVYRAAVELCVRHNARRDAIVARLARWHHGHESVLVLVDTKEHGDRLALRIPFAVMLHSGVKRRRETIEAFRQKCISCLVCTSLADEGLDVPCASVLIMAGSSKAAGKIIQRTGRVLRPSEGKTHGIIYDLHDVGHGMLSAQHWARRRVYRSQGYEVRRWEG